MGNLYKKHEIRWKDKSYTTEIIYKVGNPKIWQSGMY